MVGRLSSAPPRTALGRVQVYLGQCKIDEVHEFRELFGAVTLQGREGLRIARRLHAVDDMAGIDLDPAEYRLVDSDSSATQLEFDLDVEPFDWVVAQADLQLPVIRTPGRRIRAGDTASLNDELRGRYDTQVSVVLVLDSSWLGARHIDILLRALTVGDRDISIVLAATFDPLDSLQKIRGLRRVLQWGVVAGRRVELLRTDLAGVRAATEGATVAAIGLGTSTRHFGLPMAQRLAEEYTKRQESPLVYVPKLLHWQRGATLRGLLSWRGAGLTRCDCLACLEAGQDLMRFARVFDSTPRDVKDDVGRHQAHALSALARAVMSAGDPAGYLRQLRLSALNELQTIESVYKVRLGEPPAWLTCWD